MHGAAEDDRRVGALVRDAVAGDVPLDELVPCGPHGVLEDAGADVVAVSQREDPHGGPEHAGTVADTPPPYNPADGRAADRRVRLGRRRPDGAARVPGDAAARGLRLPRRRRAPALRPASAGRAAALRARDRLVPGGSRRQARRRRLQLGDRGGAARAPDRAARPRRRRDRARGARGGAGDAQPPDRPARDAGDGLERPLRGAGPRARRRGERALGRLPAARAADRGRRPVRRGDRPRRSASTPRR